MKRSLWVAVLVCIGAPLGMLSCTNQTAPAGNPGRGAPATLTFDNPSLGEALAQGMMLGSQKSVVIAPKVDNTALVRLGTYGRWTVPIHSGPHSLSAVLTAGQGTDALKPGLRMDFRAAPNRTYVLQATSFKREGLHRVTLLEDGKPVQSVIVPYDSYQKLDPMMVPLPVR